MNSIEDKFTLAELIEGMRSPDAYPHPVGTVEVIQTHASVVFLAGDFAYKVKKSVDFGFLNYSTLSRRKHFCEREVRLNRRLASDTYLGVVSIGRTSRGLCIDPPGEAVEFAVKMKRLPEEATLSAKSRRGELTASMVRRVARKIASFHRHGPSRPHMVEHARYATVQQAALENLEALHRADELNMPDVVARLHARTTGALERLAPMIERRALTGHPRDTHGDLRLEHVYDVPQGLRIVDCIEFNDSFRYADPIADAAFLTMDLRAHAQWALADVFVDAYIDATGDLEALALLPFYEAYRASVRAKVDTLQAVHCTDASARKDALAKARGKLLLSEGLLAPPEERACLILMYGLPGTGKSAVARQLATNANFTWLRSDVVRKELAGVAPLESRKAGPAAGIYSADWSARTYNELRQRASHVLRHGGRAIVDATFKNDAERLSFVHLAQTWHVPIRILACETIPQVARQRIEDRGSDASDADWNVYQHAAKHWEPLTAATADIVDVIDTTASLADVVQQAVAALAKHGCAKTPSCSDRSAA